MELLSLIVRLKAPHGIPPHSRQQLKEGFDPGKWVVWLHREQRDLGAILLSQCPTVDGVGSEGAMAPRA